ncbi:MAG: MATE family efflux transporter [Rhodoferax sp.]
MPAPLFPHPHSRRQALRQELHALWQLAWPILVGQLATMGMAVADVAMTGRYSADDLAGVSLGVSVWNMIIISIMGLMMAVNPMVAHHVGAQTHDEVPHLVRQALWKALGVGVLGVALAYAAAQVFDHLQASPPVRDLAVDFVHITAWALPAFAAYRVLYGYSTSLNQTKPLMVIAMVALLLNVGINALLIYGWGPFPELGGLGCAWSTLACVWFNLLAMLWWMHRSPHYRSTWPFDAWELPHTPTLVQLLRLGLPIGITYFAETSAFGLIALLVAKFGSTQAAAHQIALNVTSVLFMVPLSLGLALLARVGQALGAGQASEARFRAWTGVGVALVFALFSATVMAVWGTPIAALYTRDAAVIALCAQLLFLAAVFQLSDSAQVVVSCAVRGYKVTRAPMAIHLTAFWVFSLPLGCWLGLAPEGWPLRPSQPWGAQGFWLALVVGLTVAAVGLLLLLRHVARRAIAARA